ncbi:MAG: 16S rRNA (cytosine(1402)-N(4))-methyltransferase RsmH [Candidatus Aminicenantes bacterium]|nr:16S rRNA (cytosine(1402)-N(4))-methyltransferase RsmH [Candidatus Aminicenantes bacterium]
MTGREHIPVLREEVLDLLDPSRQGLYLDGTVGLGGHAEAILESHPRARLVGLDLDEEALRLAGERLSPYADRVRLFQADFRLIPELEIDFPSVRGLLLDLGMSSFQLDDPARGFSHSLDGPLDMRMDRRQKLTAAAVLDKYSEPKLAHLFREYGELKQAAKLARAVVSLRRTQRLESTAQLRLLVEDICRWIPQPGKIHPAAKAFQALRIEVNRELEGLGEFLETASGLLPPGARIAVISFHSLEDRIVKHTFSRLARPEDGAPVLGLLTKKPVVPTEVETARNPRSRSAKLRAGEILPHGPQEI